MGRLIRRYSSALLCLLSASYSPTVTAEYYNISLWEAIKMGVYGLVSGAYFEDDRPGIKSTYSKGSQQSVIEFDINSAQRFSGTLYLPMLSATFKIVSPDGTAVFDSEQTPVNYNLSKENDSAYPWVLYFLPELFTE
ncbi:MAG: hypothetical protein GY787_20655 [Alteromonadales bacterium]|nr:hypothetical protein [Alteromonadales bacterium]